ncbi:MAG: hypothetical protein K0B07_01210 [DPANN group archaeon]|nr:hypothetical protein [DPANN group archaeon]
MVPNIKSGINEKDFHLKCGKFEFAWAINNRCITKDSELRYYVRENYNEIIKYTSLHNAIDSFLTYTSNPNLYSRWFDFMEKVGGLKTSPAAYS